MTWLWYTCTQSSIPSNVSSSWQILLIMSLLWVQTFWLCKSLWRFVRARRSRAAWTELSSLTEKWNKLCLWLLCCTHLCAVLTQLLQLVVSWEDIPEEEVPSVTMATSIFLCDQTLTSVKMNNYVQRKHSWPLKFLSGDTETSSFLWIKFKDIFLLDSLFTSINIKITTMPPWQWWLYSDLILNFCSMAKKCPYIHFFLLQMNLFINCGSCTTSTWKKNTQQQQLLPVGSCSCSALNCSTYWFAAIFGTWLAQWQGKTKQSKSRLVTFLWSVFIIYS